MDFCTSIKGLETSSECYTAFQANGKQLRFTASQKRVHELRAKERLITYTHANNGYKRRGAVYFTTHPCAYLSWRGCVVAFNQPLRCSWFGLNQIKFDYDPRNIRVENQAVLRQQSNNRRHLLNAQSCVPWISPPHLLCRFISRDSVNVALHLVVTASNLMALTRWWWW